MTHTTFGKIITTSLNRAGETKRTSTHISVNLNNTSFAVISLNITRNDKVYVIKMSPNSLYNQLYNNGFFPMLLTNFRKKNENRKEISFYFLYKHLKTSLGKWILITTHVHGSHFSGLTKLLTFFILFYTESNLANNTQIHLHSTKISLTNNKFPQFSSILCDFPRLENFS